MAAAVGNRNILVGRPCMSLSTITPAWPSLASSPIRRPIPPSPSSGMRLTSSPATASPSALCSPITAVAIAPITFAKLVSRWASNTVALALTRRKPMAKPNASSRPPCANGPTLLTGPTPSKETTPSLLGPTTTTMPVLMVAFTTSRPSAAPNQVQPLDHLQVPHSFAFFANEWVACGEGHSSHGARRVGHPHDVPLWESAMAATTLDRQLTQLEASRYRFGRDEAASVVKRSEEHTSE